MKNDKQFTKTRTLEFLTQLDEKLESDGCQRKFKLYAMGGTKMVLLGMRHSSKDVDFLVSREDYRTLSSYRAQIEWKEKVSFDIFVEGNLPGYAYEDFERNATKAPYQFRRIELYFIDDIDFIITKVLAGRFQDLEDIKSILNIRPIPKEKIIERFRKIKFKSDKEKEFKEKFEEFLSKFYH